MSGTEGKQSYEDYRAVHNGISWREYVDMRFNEIEKATAVAHREMNRRLEGMNEIRSQLDRQAASFMTRDNCDVKHKISVDSIASIREFVAAAEARSKAYAGIISAGVSILVGLIIYFITGR